MCGRITLTDNRLPEIAALCDAELDPLEAAAFRPRYNVAPTSRHFIVRGDGDRRILAPAHWGFVVDRRPIVINARAETAAERPLFREALAHRRCVVPTDGFYEWQGEKNDRRPIWFHAPDGGLVMMAGLYQVSAERLVTFAILTTSANRVVRAAHDRMPVVLPRDRVSTWLARPAVELLVPAADDALAPREVGPRVNRVENDDPECLAPPTPPKQLRLI